MLDPGFGCDKVHRLDIVREDADGAAVLPHKVSGVGVRDIVVLPQQRFDLLPVLLIHAGFSVDHPRDGAGGDAGQLRNIVDRHVIKTPLLCY